MVEEGVNFSSSNFQSVALGLVSSECGLYTEFRVKTLNSPSWPSLRNVVDYSNTYANGLFKHPNRTSEICKSNFVCSSELAFQLLGSIVELDHFWYSGKSSFLLPGGESLHGAPKW